MIIVLKPHTTKQDIARVENMVKTRGLDTHIIEGSDMTVIGCIGDTTRIDMKLFEVDSAVSKGLIHKNNAAHKKSKLTIKLNGLAQ